jgi:hypothetical protein
MRKLLLHPLQHSAILAVVVVAHPLLLVFESVWHGVFAVMLLSEGIERVMTLYQS